MLQKKHAAYIWKEQAAYLTLPSSFSLIDLLHVSSVRKGIWSICQTLFKSIRVRIIKGLTEGKGVERSPRPMVRPHLSASAVGEAQDLCAGSEEYMPFMQTSSICPKGIPPAVNERHLFPRGGKKKLIWRNSTLLCKSVSRYLIVTPRARV